MSVIDIITSFGQWHFAADRKRPGATRLERIGSRTSRSRSRHFRARMKAATMKDEVKAFKTRKRSRIKSISFILPPSSFILAFDCLAHFADGGEGASVPVCERVPVGDAHAVQRGERRGLAQSSQLLRRVHRAFRMRGA